MIETWIDAFRTAVIVFLIFGASYWVLELGNEPTNMQLMGSLWGMGLLLYLDNSVQWILR